MRPNIVTEAGFGTKLGQWWQSIPFLTSSVVILCGAIYFVCLLVGYDSFAEVCFWPSAVISRFQVYRIFTSIIFHGSFIHVFFNMAALVDLGSELERVMGSVRLLYMIVLLAMSIAILHIIFALVISYNPFYPGMYLMNECAIGFSGILFSMIVMETSLSGVQHRSVLGLFNVPAKWYVWILLVAFQLLVTNVSFLGHLCGIFSGFAYTYGLFNFLLPGTSFYSSIESSTWLASCVRRPKFIMCTGGNTSGYIPTYTSQNITSSVLPGNLWRNLSSWIAQRDTSIQTQPAEDSRFPGRGRTLSTVQTQAVSVPDSTLQTRLLDNSLTRTIGDPQIVTARPTAESMSTTGGLPGKQGPVVAEAEIQKLVAMGFERTQVEVAVAAADGDLNVAVEILMSQQD